MLQQIILQALNKFNVQLPLDKIKTTTAAAKIDAHYCTNALFLIADQIDIKDANFQEQLKKILLENKIIQKVEFLNGYINFKMSQEFFKQVIIKINKENIFPDIGHGKKVNVEYCSINPTGFLHIGHARNAILGDSIARLFKATNFDVTKEYYINDAGNQINLLGESVFAEFNILNNLRSMKPDNGYAGAEIKDLAHLLDKTIENKTQMNAQKAGAFALNYFLEEITKDLQDLEIFHDSWVKESDIIAQGYIQKAINLLEEKNHIYKGISEEKMAHKGQVSQAQLLLLKTSAFGDDEDRPLTKADGTWTYLAPDIGYHLNKIERGAQEIICVLGADHHSYAQRIKIAVEIMAQSLNKEIKHEIPICQMVSFEDEGKILKFSKRMGNSIRSADFIKEISKDILRFMILSKAPGTPFIFDYENAISTSLKNPIFYIQYAHARGCSVLRNAKALNLEITENFNFDNATLLEPEFQELALVLANFKQNILEATKDLSIHTITNYAYKLAQTFHILWQSGKSNPSKRFIVEGRNDLSLTRIFITQAFLKTLSSTLNLLGIKALEELK